MSDRFAGSSLIIMGATGGIGSGEGIWRSDTV